MVVVAGCVNELLNGTEAAAVSGTEAAVVPLLLCQVLRLLLCHCCCVTAVVSGTAAAVVSLRQADDQDDWEVSADRTGLRCQ